MGLAKNAKIGGDVYSFAKLPNGFAPNYRMDSRQTTEWLCDHFLSGATWVNAVLWYNVSQKDNRKCDKCRPCGGYM